MSATGSAAPADAAGFTLIEMLVVLAISALVAGLVFPAVERIAGRAALVAARALVAAELAEARADALRFGRPVRVSVARDGQGLLIADGELVALPRGINLQAVPAVLGFYPDGSATGGRLLLTGDALVTALELDARQGGVSPGPVGSPDAG
jgi:prepilin-type N-terminal cleavage/methylation domain-containing protein